MAQKASKKSKRSKKQPSTRPAKSTRPEDERTAAQNTATTSDPPVPSSASSTEKESADTLSIEVSEDASSEKVTADTSFSESPAKSSPPPKEQPKGEPLIRLEGVSRSFSDGQGSLEVLKGVDWSLYEGESVAIMGRSGSGKSTMLNLIGGLDRGYSGSIIVDGMTLNTLSDAGLAAFRNQKIGFIFQSFHLIKQLTCEENVMLPAWFSKQNEIGMKQAKELLDRVGLSSKIGKRPGPFSGGEKQRIAIARALLMKPKILLCDEPTGNLDEQTSEEILSLFLRLQKEEGLTFLMVTHETQAASIADRIFVLQKGSLSEQPKETNIGK